MHKQSEKLSYNHRKCKGNSVRENLCLFFFFLASYRVNSLHLICLSALSVPITYPFTLAAYLFETQFGPNASVDNNAVLIWLLVVLVKFTKESP